MKKSYTLSLEKKEWNNCLHDVYDKKKKDIKIDGFNILPVLSISMAATTFAGQNIGAGNADRG